jgi:hypothetical protein
MSVRKRNPILGGIMAALFIGFGGWRLYDYYVLKTPMEMPYVVLGYGIVVYGLYLVYSLITQKNG